MALRTESRDRHNVDITLYYHFYNNVTRAINSVHSCIHHCSAAAGGNISIMRRSHFSHLK